MKTRFKTVQIGASKLMGMHPDIIISDAIPTKLQMWLHKINPFKRWNKERDRAYEWFENMKKPNNEEELKEAILKEGTKIAEEEVLKLGILSFSGKHRWISGFVAGYLYRTTEVMKQQNGK